MTSTPPVAYPSTPGSSPSAAPQGLGGGAYREVPFAPFSGWLMVPLWLIILLGNIAIFVATVRATDSRPNGPPPAGVVAVILLLLLLVLIVPGFFIVNPNESRAMLLFGHYRGTVRKIGFHWTNPFTSKKRVSLRVRTFETGSQQTADVRDAAGKVVHAKT